MGQNRLVLGRALHKPKGPMYLESVGGCLTMGNGVSLHATGCAGFRIKGPGPRAWAELTPSVCHGALLAPLPVAYNKEVELKALLRWRSQQPYNHKLDHLISIMEYRFQIDKCNAYRAFCISLCV